MTKHTWLRKLGGLLLAVCLLCSSASALAAGEDLLVAGSWTADWTFTPSAEDGASLAEEDGAAVITVTEGSAVLSKETKFSLDRAVNAVSFTAKAADLAEGSEAVIRLLRVENTDVNECQSAPVTATEWTPVTMYFTPGTGAKKMVEIALMGTGKLYVKDMTVELFEGDNLIPYGNAEAYAQNNSKAFTGGDAVKTDEQKYEGLASYRGTKMRTDVLPVTPGHTYRLSFAFYSASAVKPNVQIGWNSTSNAATDHLLATCTAGEWNTYTYYITVPQTFGEGDAKASITGMYLFLRSSGGTIYYDAVSLEKRDAGFKNASDSDAAFTAGETVTAFTTVEAGKSGTAIAALYKKSGECRVLIGVETAPIAAAEAVQAATVNYTLPEEVGAGEYAMTIFAWDMENGLSSLKDAYTHTWTVQ